MLETAFINVMIWLCGFLCGVILIRRLTKKPKNVGTLMIIDTKDEGLALFVELNQEIYMFKDEKSITMDISHK